MKYFLNILLILLIYKAYSQQQIEIVGGSKINMIKINVNDFKNDKNDINNIADIIVHDLNISGEFDASIYNIFSQFDGKVNYIITGNIDNNKVSYSLKNTNNPNEILLNNTVFNISANKRYIAHTISNQIYQYFTHTKGIFTSKIAFVAKENNKYNLIVSDYDGYNKVNIFTSDNAISSLTWRNNDSQIAYMSLEQKKPMVYVQNVYIPKKYLIANFLGSNSSPNFVSTGNKLTVTLTKDKGSHIYLVENTTYSNNSTAYPLINYGSIDTEASTNNNDDIIFTSNHDGGPQIFLSSLKNPKIIKRVTINLGDYNTSAKFAHNIKKITFIHREFNTLKAYVEDLNSGINFPISSNTKFDTAPSFAPNDKLILFSSENKIYITDINSTKTTLLDSIKYDQIIDQCWSNNY